MLMVLFILFIISVLGMGIILVRHRKHGHNNLLHYMKKSCNIDSIAFEKKLEKTSKKARGLIDVSKKSSQKIAKNVHKSTSYLVHSSKKKIRKTLFKTKHTGVVSDFISYLKDHSKK